MICRFLFSAWFSMIAQECLAQAEGSMSCKVTSNTVIASEDGKAKTYSRYEGGFATGDTLVLTYTAGTDNDYFSFSFEDKKRKKSLFYASFRPTELDKVHDGSLAIFSEHEGPVSAGVSFGQDYIRLEGFSRLFLNRYYKSDWHGMYVDEGRIPNAEIQVATLDCRTTVDLIDDVLHRLGKITAERVGKD